MKAGTPDAVVQFLLVKLTEECAEVIQACTKILEHGYVAQNAESKILYDNAMDLARELGDALAAMHVLCENIPMSVRNSALNHHSIEDFAVLKRKILRDLAAKRKG